MTRFVRRINVVLLLLLVLEPPALVQPGPAAARGEAPAAEGEATPFLYLPYYGARRMPCCWFDHRYPTYRNPPNDRYSDMVDKFGRVGSRPYDGHDGYDFPLVYEPVLAGAAGMIGYAGWASWDHEANLGLMTRIVHFNGFQTRYGHLSAVMYRTGEWIGARWQLGTSGDTGNSTGPHLHLTVVQLVNDRWYATDPFGWSGAYSDPWQIWSGTTSRVRWVDDPTTPAPREFGSVLVDERGPHFGKWCAGGASCPYWFAAPVGHNGHMWWTWGNRNVESYWARWVPRIPADGLYEVQVFIPNHNATAHAARYTVNYASGRRTVVVDQHDTYGPGRGRWVSLGQHFFHAGASGWVQLSDAGYIGNYIDPYSVRVGVDAARFIRRSP